MFSTQQTLLRDALAASCPLIAVLTVRTLLAPAPSVAGTAAPAPQLPTPIPAIAESHLSPEQQRAIDWIATLDTLGGMTSPLDHPGPIVAAPVAREPEPVLPVPILNPLAGLKLSGILGNDTGGLAAINNRIYKVGDVVRPGLTVKSIDARTNTVVFRQYRGPDLTLHRSD